MQAAKNTFSHVATEMLTKASRLSEPALIKKRWLIAMANESLADRLLAQITAPEGLAVLRQVESRGNLETARRLRPTTSQVFRYGIATAVAEHGPDLRPPRGDRAAGRHAPRVQSPTALR